MTPAEALSLLIVGDPKRKVPGVYRQMPPGMLPALVKEIGSAASTAARDEPVAPSACPVQALLRRAIARPERLGSPARRRVAFLQHYAGSRNLIEAAARAGIDRRTVHRWRRVSPAFDRHLNQIVSDRRDDAYEHALLMTRRPAMRPVYWRGQKVGEYEVPNTALALYVLKQADTEHRREEDRRLAAEKAAEATAFGEGIERGRARVLEMRRRQQEEEAERRVQQMAQHRSAWGNVPSGGNEEMSHSPGNEKMSHSLGHRLSPEQERPLPASSPSAPASRPGTSWPPSPSLQQVPECMPTT
jgi:hypothetical protein